MGGGEKDWRQGYPSTGPPEYLKLKHEVSLMESLDRPRAPLLSVSRYASVLRDKGVELAK